MGVGPNNLFFWEASRWFSYTFEFENYWFTINPAVCSGWLQWSCGFSDLVSWSDLHIRSSSTSTTREVTLGMPCLCNPKVLCAAFWPQPRVLLALPVSSTHYQFCQFPLLLQAGPYCMPSEVLTLLPRHFEKSQPWMVTASSFSTLFGWQNTIPGNRVTVQTWCSFTLWVKPLFQTRNTAPTRLSLISLPGLFFSIALVTIWWYCLFSIFICLLATFHHKMVNFIRGEDSFLFCSLYILSV